MTDKTSGLKPTQCSTWRQVLAQDALARRRQGGVCTTSLPGTRYGGITCSRQTNSRLFSTLSLTCTAFQELTRHMLSGQPQLEYHGAGTRYAVPDLPYKCHLCHKKFRDMGGMMQHQVWKKSIEKNKFLMQLTFQDSAHNVVNRRLALC